MTNFKEIFKKLSEFINKIFKKNKEEKKKEKDEDETDDIYPLW